MQSTTFRKLTSVTTTVLSAFLLLTNPSVHADHPTAVSVVKPITEYLPSFPWVGLLMDEVTYGPITVSDVHINKGSKLAVVKPGEMLHGHLKYHVDSSNQHLFHRYHLVVGIKGLGAQDCVTHTYGIWDSKGRASFTLKAPLEPGLYEVRFFYQEAHTCEEARSVWNEHVGEPSSYATIGAIIVE